jgi:heme-degrading monooxygenase HmoA
MIVSFHLADVGPRAAMRALRKPPAPARVPGLGYAETVTAAPLGGSLLPSPRPGRVGMIAAWEDDEALDEFNLSNPLAATFAAGWQVRMQPLRVSGHWPEMPWLPAEPLPVDDAEPVVALTLGRLRLGRAVPFLRSAAAAEADAVEDAALLASTGLARPPRLVSTFSIWRSMAAMREYAYGKTGAHQAAVRDDRAHPFHHVSAFVRFRPYASHGQWDGCDPLAQVPSGLNL